MPESTEDGNTLERKLLSWLATEGYPLEFATAQAFRHAGFSVRQGYYTDPREGAPSREIDVLASMDHGRRDILLRVVHIVECKWSGNKPWVLFCGGHAISTAACATQMIGSHLGETLLWKDAGSKLFRELELFRTPDEPAFGGRQGFSGSRDLLFDALRSVTGAAQSVVKEYDGLDGIGHTDNLPPNGVIALPVIVITGRLFEVRQDDGGDLALLEVDNSRIHWRGAGRIHVHTTVDVVRSDKLDEFLDERAKDVKKLLNMMSSSTDELLRCIVEGSFESLNVPRAARGVVGKPSLINRLSKYFQSQQALPPT